MAGMGHAAQEGQWWVASKVWVADSCRCKCVQVSVGTLLVVKTVGYLSHGQVAWSCVCAPPTQQMQKPDRWHGASARGAFAAAPQVHVTVNMNNAVSKRLLKMLPSNKAQHCIHLVPSVCCLPSCLRCLHSEVLQLLIKPS